MPDATDTIVSAVRCIEQMLADYSGGVDNKEARAGIDSQLRTIRDNLSFGNDKIESLREWAAILL